MMFHVKQLLLAFRGVDSANGVDEKVGCFT